MGGQFDAVVDDMSMAALGAYTRMARGWRPEPVGVPTLLVRATEPAPQMRFRGGYRAGDEERRTSWLEPYDTVDVPGEHWTVNEDHAHTTAGAIQTWLSALGATAG